MMRSDDEEQLMTTLPDAAAAARLRQFTLVLLALNVLATIRPVPASTPRCSIRHDRRVAVPCFSSSHSPLPHSFKPVLSTSRCRGSPSPAPAVPGRGTSSVAARRLKVVWSGTRKLRPSRPTMEPISPSACR